MISRIWNHPCMAFLQAPVDSSQWPATGLVPAHVWLPWDPFGGHHRLSKLFHHPGSHSHPSPIVSISVLKWELDLQICFSFLMVISRGLNILHLFFHRKYMSSRQKTARNNSSVHFSQLRKGRGTGKNNCKEVCFQICTCIMPYNPFI
jgi:hypothetical protein